MTLALVQGINDLHQPMIIADAWHGEQRRLPLAPAELGEQDTGLGEFDPSPFVHDKKSFIPHPP